MSHHNEFQELEEQLRRSKPAAEPVPPAFKQQLRARLMENKPMNSNRFSFPSLGTALAAVALLVAIPLLYWLSMSSFRPEPPAVGSDDTAGVISGDGLDPQRPADNDSALEKDSVAILSASPQAGTPLFRNYPLLMVTLEYVLSSAEQAELQVSLDVLDAADGGRGVGNANVIIPRGQGKLTLPILYDVREIGGQTAEMGLSVRLSDLDSNAGKLLFLDFPADFQWEYRAETMQSAEFEPAYAAIREIGQPVPYESDNLPPGSEQLQVDVAVDYAMPGYTEGYITLNYEVSNASGSAGGGASQAVSDAQGSVIIPVTFGPEFFNEDGSFRDAITLDAELQAIDEISRQQIPVYPPPEVAIDTAQEVSIQALALAQNGQLNVSVSYARATAEEAGLVVTVLDSKQNVIVSERIPVYQRQEIATIPIALDTAGLPASEPLRVQARLETGETVLADELELTAGDLQSDDQDRLWLIATDLVSRPLGSMPDADYLRVLVGYSLTSAYDSGMLEHEFSITQAAAPGGGGGGGGGQPLAPGSGVLILFIPLNEEQSATAATWPLGLQLEVTLQGHLADGSQVELATLARPQPQ